MSFRDCFQPEYKLADPICTFLFSVLVLATTITILKDTIKVLMEGEGGKPFICIVQETTL